MPAPSKGSDEERDQDEVLIKKENDTNGIAERDNVHGFVPKTVPSATVTVTTEQTLAETTAVILNSGADTTDLPGTWYIR
jgi:hypothetical protein